MKAALVVAAILFGWKPHALAKPSRTYFLEVTGDKKVARKLIHELTAKDCFSLADLGEYPSDARPDGCHAFRRFENKKQISGSLKQTGSSFLYKIAIHSPRKFNLQIFQRDGKSFRRILNAGDFNPPDLFFTQLKRTTVGLTFK